MSTRTAGFLFLPTELRLEVYRHLTISAIAVGSSTSIDNFKLSCKTIYNEIDSEIMPKVGNLLDVQRQWNSKFNINAPLRIQLPDDHNSSLTLSKIMLSIPISSQFDPRRERQPDRATFVYLVALLRRLVQTPLSTLTIEFYYQGLPGNSIWYRASTEILGSLFSCMMRCSKKDDKLYFSQIERLVVRLGVFGTCPHRLHSDFELRFILRQLQRNCGWREVKRLRGTNEGTAQDPAWTLWIDFEEDLPWTGGNAEEFKVYTRSSVVH